MRTNSIGSGPIAAGVGKVTKRERGRPRSEKLHRAILKATLEILAETGVPELSIEAVAARARVGKHTIYRRWPSKLPLVVDAMSTLPEMKIPATGSLRGDLLQIAHYLERALRPAPIGGVLLHVVTAVAHDPELDNAIGTYLTARQAPLIEVMQRGIERGEIPVGTDPAACADLFAGAIVNRLFFSRRPFDQRFVEFIISRLAGDWKGGEGASRLERAVGGVRARKSRSAPSGMAAHAKRQA